MKTITGFLNTDGGILLIGVADSKQILGIEDDYKTFHKADRDGYELHLNQLISNYIGKERCLNISISFHEIDGRDVCMVQVEPSPKPAYLEEGQESRFYIRTGNQTQPLDTKESYDYILEHWPV
jgi:predicted HTH transcriptional regulator